MPRRAPATEIENRAPSDADARAAELARVAAARFDPGQFAPLYEAHFERVYAFVVRRVKLREEAEDITSEVFRRALSGLRGFEPRGVPFSAWLIRIAANAVIDASRRARPASALTGQERGEAPDDDALQDAERRAQLFRAVATLPDDQRRVIELRFGEAQPVRAIASRLGRSEGAVKQLQLRALRALRRMLRDEAEGSAGDA